MMLEIIFALQVAVATILISVRTWDFLRLLAGASFKRLYRKRQNDLVYLARRAGSLPIQH